ncbi:DUF1178 family protein [Pseudodonghicola flavimaris]|uniref:DUF1178 family protein n=1 Tax=Pseudodonghicola flavimaris TaxID=3050036 RepID=A0ABT7F3F4_9RHOB|nr:DUF1178 family protein [Pseudodonghicola flavimaris]MDK3019141.1 DUF1178 family protein [Pseudodonghicola flavimaris]
MIQYALKCAEGHTFDSWFQSADAFDKLAGAGMVQCVVCGSTRVEKALMAPRVSHGRDTDAPQPPAAEAPERPLTAPANAAEQALAELKRKIEENSEYVGMNFAEEARAIHEGEAPERPIYGEAKTEEARALIEDGVPVTPLPFLPNRKAN